MSSKFQGVILSDDLEMKAIAKTYTVPDAAVEAIAAGCDGLLVCSGDVDVQAATLEALVYAVEQDRTFPTSGSRMRSAGCDGRRSASSRLPSTSQKVSRHQAGARLRCASAHRRRDGKVPLGAVRKPRALKPGDRIAIVAPASPFSRDEFTRGVAEIERLGFVPVFDDSVFAQRVGLSGRVAGGAGGSVHQVLD